MFADRSEAGRRLAPLVADLISPWLGGAPIGHRVVVVGLPRGGVPVAVEVGHALGAPIDVILVRKLGVPWQRELAAGAIGEDGVRVVNDDVIRITGVTAHQIADVEREERAELDRRVARFRGAAAALALEDRIVVVVDDGLATGATARAACAVARAHGAQRVVLAVPVAPSDWIERLGSAADGYVCVVAPEWFSAVGEHYRDFAAVTDDEVVAMLERERARQP